MEYKEVREKYLGNFLLEYTDINKWGTLNNLPHYNMHFDYLSDFEYELRKNSPEEEDIIMCEERFFDPIVERERIWDRCVNIGVELDTLFLQLEEQMHELKPP
jgi:hypothetical protein